VDLERYTLPVPGVSTIPADELSAFRAKANDFLNFEHNYNLRTGNTDLAIRDFENLSKKYPKLAKVWYYLAMAHRKEGNTQKAEAALERLQEVDPAGEFLSSLPVSASPVVA
jgi:tetratricopeptide (TPR) repeat protein